jgi:hypothetical protein
VLDIGTIACFGRADPVRNSGARFATTDLRRDVVLGVTVVAAAGEYPVALPVAAALVLATKDR